LQLLQTKNLGLGHPHLPQIGFLSGDGPVRVAMSLEFVEVVKYSPGLDGGDIGNFFDKGGVLDDSKNL
jgi:hypothetical protein